MLTPDGHYYNFSGCGNTLNCNHPVVRDMILECLRYWVIEYRVDGFRFDLASILGRNDDGTPLSQPPLLRSLAFDSILGNVKLIAEAWDAGGLYQVGSFPSWKRWAEWNGRYRDDMRRFLKEMTSLPRLLPQESQVLLICTILLTEVEMLPSTFSPVMMASRFVTCTVITRSIMKPTVGGTLTELTTITAGTVA